jgi:hypothetical protein
MKAESSYDGATPKEIPSSKHHSGQGKNIARVHFSNQSLQTNTVHPSGSHDQCGAGDGSLGPLNLAVNPTNPVFKIMGAVRLLDEH